MDESLDTVFYTGESCKGRDPGDGPCDALARGIALFYRCPGVQINARDEFLTRLVFFFCLLILIATVVHQFADWWDGVGLHLDQIEIPFTTNIKRTLGGHDAAHLTFFFAYAHLAALDGQ